MSNQSNQKNTSTEPNQTPKPKTDTYFVKGPGQLLKDGKVYKPNQIVELTRAEAKALGDGVVKGEPPKPPRAINKRTAGTYLVTGPGMVRHDGEDYGPGQKLQLDAAQARSLGNAIVEA